MYCTGFDDFNDSRRQEDSYYLQQEFPGSLGVIQPTISAHPKILVMIQKEGSTLRPEVEGCGKNRITTSDENWIERNHMVIPDTYQHRRQSWIFTDQSSHSVFDRIRRASCTISCSIRTRPLQGSVTSNSWWIWVKECATPSAMQPYIFGLPIFPISDAWPSWPTLSFLRGNQKMNRLVDYIKKEEFFGCGTKHIQLV